MKIVFLSNYFNHHQKPFSDAMYQLLGNNYTFIETDRMSDERKKLGYGISKISTYVVFVDDFKKDTAKYLREINNADIVITGSAPEKLLFERKRNRKLILRYSERPLKTGNNIVKYPLRLLKWHIKSPMYKPIYMLCASAYTAADYAKFGLFKNRCFKWGYFPEYKQYEDVDSLILSNKEPASILWAGRFIEWKHPEASIEVAKRLKQNGYSFTINLIGNGVLEEQLRQRIIDEDLSDCVNMLGSMKPDEVRKHMEQSEIFLFTSDRNEGWGAVLNESMNSACAVVASHAIGSVPFLIEDGISGVVYKDGNMDSLFEKTKWLLDHPVERKSIAKNAYKTIREEWSPEIAAKRLVSLSEALLAGKKNSFLFENGPCSRAELLADNWIDKA